MKASARLESRPVRAASEFFHAALTFLCAHCVVGSLLAPALRLFVSGLCPEWVEGAAAGWAELEAAGGAGWPSWGAGSALLAGGEAADRGERGSVPLAVFRFAVRAAGFVSVFSLFLLVVVVGVGVGVGVGGGDAGGVGGGVGCGMRVVIVRPGVFVGRI